MVQTLKLWLGKQPPAATVAELQQQLDRFRDVYTTQRPHRALGPNRHHIEPDKNYWRNQNKEPGRWPSSR